MKATVLALAALSMAISSCWADEPSTSINAPRIDLAITLEQLSGPNSVHLSATNCGAAPVLIVRPRVHTLDQLDSWGGWSLRVHGPGGPLHAFPFPGGIQPFTTLDLVELRSHESVGVILDLSKFTPDGRSLLADLPGRYTVVVGYHLKQDKVVSASGTANGEGFVDVPRLPAVESEPIRFVVLGKGRGSETREESPNKAPRRIGCGVR